MTELEQKLFLKVKILTHETQRLKHKSRSVYEVPHKRNTVFSLAGQVVQFGDSISQAWLYQQICRCFMYDPEFHNFY